MMKNLITLILGLSFLSPITNLQSQCRCSIEELKSIIEKQKEVDPIVGLYLLNSKNVKINKQDSIIYGTSPNISAWIIKPVGDHFEVCHTEFTKYENFEAKIFRLEDDTYIYKSNLRTGEVAVSQMLITELGISNSYQLPPKLYMEMYGLDEPDGFSKYWEFTWEKIDITTKYSNFADIIKTATPPIKSMSIIQIVDQNSLRLKLKLAINIPGYNYIVDMQSIGKFVIKHSYSIYPGVETIIGNYDGFEEKFEIDIDKETLDIISIRPMTITTRAKLHELSRYLEDLNNPSSRSDIK